MVTERDVIKAHEELEQINNDIIKKQEEHIKLLEEHIAELRAIIKKYLLKDVES